MAGLYPCCLSTKPPILTNIFTFRENLGWAATCQTIGQTLGGLVGFTFFMIFESPDMCNDYFRSTPVPGKGLISFSGMLIQFGVPLTHFNSARFPLRLWSNFCHFNNTYWSI